MKLERLSLTNCGGFEHVDIDFEPDVTLIAGINGIGKSTLLRIIATLISKAHRRLNLSRQHPLRFDRDIVFIGKRAASAKLMMNVGDVKLVAELHAVLDWRKFELFQLVGLTKEANHQNMLAVLFTPKRQLPGQPRSQAGTSPFDPSIAFNNALYDREVELREFMHWFRTQEKLGVENEPRRLRVLDALRSVVSELVPEFSNLRVQQSPRLGFVVDKRGQPFYLHQLSDGERGLLALVFDLTRRLAIANPESDNPIAEGVAVVLIDEIELHLHPKWQRDAIKRLPTIFENCQFVITTHSPQVIGEVQAGCVRLLSIKDGRVITETPGMAYGADSNWILNVLMGANDMDEDVEKELENIARLISDRNLKVAKEQTGNLRSRVGNTEAIQKLASIIERIERLGK